MNVPYIQPNTFPEYKPELKPEFKPELKPDFEIEKPVSPEEKNTVSSTFLNLLDKAIASEAKADQIAQSYAAGHTQHIHETMLALEKANINFTLLVNVRNKLLDAYQQVMRMS